jgi:hypothetical protein
MPAAFKTLTSIVVWILFTYGLAAIIYGFVRAFSHASLAMVSAYFGYGLISLFLSVVSAKIRKSLD